MISLTAFPALEPPPKNSHLRPGRAFWLAAASAGLISGCCSLSGPAPHSGLPAKSYQVAIDRDLRPSAVPLPVFADGQARPIATMTDSSGIQADFVENELMIEIATEAELQAFLAQWHGEVLAVDRPSAVGLEADPTYLIRVETERAELSSLAGNLETLNPKGASPISVGSAAGRRLIAIAAATAVTGKHVGINFLTTSYGFQDGQLAEAPSSSRTLTSYSGNLVETWNPNPSQWVYMKSGGLFDIGVAGAWKVLERNGAFKNKVKIAVIDGGFGDGIDFPQPYEYDDATQAAHDPTGPNENACGKDNPCPWHGWNAVHAAIGQVDNGIGAAGPGGPVGKLLAIRRTADIFSNLQAITNALFRGASIINMSFGTRVPALAWWSVIPFDLATLRAEGAGKMLFAAAGNSGEDINEEDCTPELLTIGGIVDQFCWESAWWTPCENGGVICVGAMDAFGPYRRPSSNYGGDELDIWGPGSVWVGGDYGDNAPHMFTGTSAASPFVAGVAALIWAANPGLDNAGVERVLYETAHHGKHDQIERWPNLYAAVIRAMGGTPPEIAIDAKWDASVQVFGACRPRYLLTANVMDPDHLPTTVTWSSDRDGVLGVGASLTSQLSDGTHRITAMAVDGLGLSALSNEVVLEVRNPTGANAPKPTIDLLSLDNQQTFAANQPITLEAAGSDPAVAFGHLIAANVRWDSSADGDLGAGQRISRKLSVGAHWITVRYTGQCGAMADDQRLIRILKASTDTPPEMKITIPPGNDLVLNASNGEACLPVAGSGFDKEDQDSATIEWWETDRSDVQWKVLSFDQNTTVCLKLAPNAPMTVHEIRLKGVDRTGNHAFSAPLRVTVVKGPR
jgi:serine protease